MYYGCLDIKDFEEIPEPDAFTGQFSDFFLETYPLVFPKTYAQEVYNFFQFVAHPYRRCWDRPAKSPRNEEIESAIKNKGKEGSHTFLRDTGRFMLHRMQEWMFKPTYEGRKHYYTSDRRMALAYFDVDCHKAFQTSATGRAARTIIEEECYRRLGVAPAFLGSSRGENGYLKVDLAGTGPEDANRVFDDLQEAIRLLLSKHGNLADFEIKGTITWMDENGKLHAGRYGKLPTSSPDWSYKWFLAFRRERSVTLDDLSRLVAEIKAEVTDEDVRRHDQAKHRAILAHYLPLGSEQEWKLNRDIGDAWEDDCLTYRGQRWVARRMVKEALIDKLWPNYRPDDLVLHEQEAVESRSQRGPALPPEVEVFLALERGENADDTPATLPNDTKPARSKRAARSVGRLAEEPDSFKRQREALLVFARLLKRVPTLDEALDLIKKQSLFMPPWNDNLAARRARVRGILRYIARTFDPAKCKQRTVNAAKLETWAEVNAGKYQGWAKKKFPSGLVGGKKEYVGQDGEIVRQWLHVGPEFIGVFVAVCEFALLVDKNEDRTLPHERARQTWKALHKKGLVSVPFCDRKWAVCRDELEKHGIVVVTDREFQAGKAMEWDVGRFFPGQGRWKAKKEPSLLDPVSWTEFRLQELATTRREHKTLLRQQSVWNRVSVLLPPVRPPPPTLGARTLW